MNGKGLTPTQLQVVYVNASGDKVGTYGPFTGLADAVSAVNENSAYEPAVSYYKAYRGVRQYGIHTEQLISQEADSDGTRAALIVIISAAPGHEVKPGFALAQEPASPAPAPLFEVAGASEDLASLAALAKDINASAAVSKGAKKPLAPSKPASPKKRPSEAVAGFEARMYRIEYYTFSEAGQRSETTSVHYLKAGTKKLARDVAREKAAGARIQIIHVEAAPSRKVASKKFVV